MDGRLEFQLRRQSYDGGVDGSLWLFFRFKARRGVGAVSAGRLNFGGLVLDCSEADFWT